MSIVVMKIGGGAITDKSSSKPSLLRENLDLVVSGVKAGASTGTRFVLVVGAGSFGHGKAKEAGFGVKDGVNTTEEASLAATDVRDQVLELCCLVERALRKESLACFRFSPIAWDEEAVTRTIVPRGKWGRGGGGAIDLCFSKANGHSAFVSEPWIHFAVSW